MTIKELFDEYKQFARETDPDVSHNPNDCTDCKIMKERMADIIQEVEALVRKETIEEILTLEYKKYIAPAFCLFYRNPKLTSRSSPFLHALTGIYRVPLYYA